MLTAGHCVGDCPTRCRRSACGHSLLSIFSKLFPKFSIFRPNFLLFFQSKKQCDPEACHWSLPSPIAGPSTHPIAALVPSPAGASRRNHDLPGSPATPLRPAREGVKLPNPFFFVFFLFFFLHCLVSQGWSSAGEERSSILKLGFRSGHLDQCSLNGFTKRNWIRVFTFLQKERPPSFTLVYL